MTDIKELALRVAKESPWYYDNEPVGDSDAIDFAQRFLAAYLAEQEPVAWFDDHYHDFSHVERFGWKPLYAAPPLPEPAPQQDKQEAGDYGLTGSSAVGAAPSSEEVRVVVDRLRIWHRDGGSLTARDAADLIERLAARVPDGCVVVPKSQITHYEKMLEAASRQLARWQEKYGKHQPNWPPPAGDVTLQELLDEAMIAAREVKP